MAAQIPAHGQLVAVPNRGGRYGLSGGGAAPPFRRGRRGDFLTGRYPRSITVKQNDSQSKRTRR